MKLSERTHQILAVRRDHRDRIREGWEYVGEKGGRLWELHRGGRWRQKIVDVRIAACGKALWVKTSAIEAK